MDSVGLLHDFARLARMLAKYSPCKRRGVACVIVDPDSMQIVGWGVNEPAHGRICSGEKDGCGCLHSEVNTILNSEPRGLDNVLVCSRAPCAPCASVIVNCGFISSVYVLDDSEPGASGIAVLRSAKIPVERLSVPDDAETGLRDKSMAASDPIKGINVAMLREELDCIHNQLAYSGCSNVEALTSRKIEIERKLQQVQ